LCVGSIILKELEGVVELATPNPPLTPEGLPLVELVEPVELMEGLLTAVEIVPLALVLQP